MDTEKYNAYAQCIDCATWTYIIGSWHTYGNITKNAICENCRGGRFDPHSVTSKSTFDPVAAKKRKPKGFKKK